MARIRTKEARRAEYRRSQEKESRDARELGFSSRYALKKWLKEKRNDPNPNKRPPERYKGSRVQMVRDWREAFESKKHGFPSLREPAKRKGQRRYSPEPLPQAVKKWYVERRHYMSSEEWDAIYGRPQR